MNKTVIDLEFTPIPSKFKEIRKICRHEIIEIGAVKLDENDEIVDKFDVFVKPQMAVITPEIHHLTGISDADVSRGLSFEKALDSFIDWIGNEETVIYSWSNNDLYQIKKEAAAKEYSNELFDNLFKNWKDLQAEFGEKLGVEQSISLSNALGASGIIFLGREHSAADDAENTAMLYQMMVNEPLFKERMSVVIEALAPSKPLTYSLASFFPESMKLQYSL